MCFDIVNLRLPCTENKTHPHQQTKNNETTRAGRERQSIVNTYAGVTGQSWVSVFCFFSFFGRKDLRCQILQATGGHTAHCKRNGFALTKIGMTRATKNKICEKKTTQHCAETRASGETRLLKSTHSIFRPTPDGSRQDRLALRAKTK